MLCRRKSGVHRGSCTTLAASSPSCPQEYCQMKSYNQSRAPRAAHSPRRLLVESSLGAGEHRSPLAVVASAPRTSSATSTRKARGRGAGAVSGPVPPVGAVEFPAKPHGAGSHPQLACSRQVGSDQRSLARQHVRLLGVEREPECSFAPRSMPCVDDGARPHGGVSIPPAEVTSSQRLSRMGASITHYARACTR